jgi:hypothetical protein
MLFSRVPQGDGRQGRVRLRVVDRNFNKIIAMLELKWIEATTEAERDKITEFVSLMMFGFVCGLRGEEIVKVDKVPRGKQRTSRVSSLGGAFVGKAQRRNGREVSYDSLG